MCVRMCVCFILSMILNFPLESSTDNRTKLALISQSIVLMMAQIGWLTSQHGCSTSADGWSVGIGCT